MSRYIIDGYKCKHALKRNLIADYFKDALLAFGPYDLTIEDVEKFSLRERAEIFDFIMDQYLSAGDHCVRNKRKRPEFFKFKECSL